MSAAPAIAAVDWGTSHLRIWLLDAKGAVLAEKRSDEGLMALQRSEFPVVLDRHLRSMGVADTLPAIVCGMAGSRQGWIEAPYLTAPAALTDVLDRAVIATGSVREVRIVPGIAQRLPEAPDVIRGEETQLAGLGDLIGKGRHLVCMPGTHCKWVEVEDGTIARFGTWMTGELFSVLSTQSILRHAVAAVDAGVTLDNRYFRDWLIQALSAPADMTAQLFQIRASALLFEMSPKDASAALSGLLVGTEIASAAAKFGRGRSEIILVASGRLQSLYAEGLKAAGHTPKSVDADRAVCAGLFEAARRHWPLQHGVPA
ncbi:MAG: 2-dehydro-3-deoxygalactonokinase [Mesorhizobium sp.]